MPCRDYLSQVRRSRGDIEALGASVLAVASGAAHQAQALQEDGMWFPLLVDPPKRVAAALGIGRIGLGWLDPTGWWTYGRALVRGARQGRITDPLQAPGIALLDVHGTARFVHRGTTLGDYPRLRTVLDRLRAL